MKLEGQSDVCAWQEDVVSTLVDWVADPSCAGNATTLTVAGIIYANEGNDVEALKACHSGLSLEMCAPVLLTLRHSCQLSILFYQDSA